MAKNKLTMEVGVVADTKQLHKFNKDLIAAKDASTRALKSLQALSKQGAGNQFLGAFKGASTQVEGLKKDLNSLGSQIEVVGKAAAPTENQIKKLEQAFSAAKNRITNTKREITRLSNQIKNSTDDTGRYKEGLANLTRDMKKSGTSASALFKQVKALIPAKKEAAEATNALMSAEKKAAAVSKMSKKEASDKASQWKSEQKNSEAKQRAQKLLDASDKKRLARTKALIKGSQGRIAQIKKESRAIAEQAKSEMDRAAKVANANRKMSNQQAEAFINREKQLDADAKATRKQIALENKVTGAKKKSASAFKTYALNFGKYLLVYKAGGAIIDGFREFLKSTIKNVIDFDREFRRASTIAGEFRSNLDDAKASIQAFSANMGVDAVASTKAFYNILSAGFKKDPMKILKASTEAARAGFVDIEDATKALTAVMNIFNKSAEESTEINTVLFNSIDQGVFKYDDLADGLATAGQSAQAVGASFEELMGILSATSKTTQGMSKAATQVRSVMTAMLKPSKEMLQVFDALGVATGEELVDKFGGALNAFEAIRQASDSYGIKLAEVLGRKEALNAMLALTGKNYMDTAIVVSKVKGNTENYKSALDQANESLQVQLDKTGEAIKLQSRIVAAPIVAEATRILSVLNKVIGDTGEEYQKRAASFAELSSMKGKSPIDRLFGLDGSTVGNETAAMTVLISKLVYGVDLLDEMAKAQAKVKEQTKKTNQALAEQEAFHNKWNTTILTNITAILTGQEDWERSQKAVKQAYKETENQIKRMSSLIAQRHNEDVAHIKARYGLEVDLENEKLALGIITANAARISQIKNSIKANDEIARKKIEKETANSKMVFKKNQEGVYKEWVIAKKSSEELADFKKSQSEDLEANNKRLDNLRAKRLKKITLDTKKAEIAALEEITRRTFEDKADKSQRSHREGIFKSTGALRNELNKTLQAASVQIPADFKSRVEEMLNSFRHADLTEGIDIGTAAGQEELKKAQEAQRENFKLESEKFREELNKVIEKQRELNQLAGAYAQGFLSVSGEMQNLASATEDFNSSLSTGLGVIGKMTKLLGQALQIQQQMKNLEDAKNAGSLLGTIGAGFGIATGGLGMLGTFASMFMHKGGPISRYHSGGVPNRLSAGEVPIIAQTGEYMLSRRAVQNMGGPNAVDGMHKNARAGGSGGSGGTNVNLNLAFDPDNFRSFITGTAEGRDIVKNAVIGAFPS